ncbi:lethal giant larvae like, C-terminal-domain-containing protein [Irpex rosettiformis]|uniref:Lethal giant larvae like, C-terminal-domain-containing protein n=1 Tax=Irpex rosettiformis TaxID=378272 RepID=A0ACB8UI54_9APHY|nr:lethal giant larvae like, C-terminal-domain-containing protein [Irpex rosettiformis]
MVRSRTDPVFLDLSAELNDELDWKAGTLRTFDHHLDITAWAYEPLSHLLAIGTSNGIIDLFGGPGVEHRLHVTDRAHIRSLYFASSCFKLLAIDLQNRLHVWDLTTPSAPRLQNIMHFRRTINCLTVSSSHTHAFIALANGEVQTYDLLCSRQSPYTVPNLWAIYEGKVFAGGLQRPNSGRIPIDLVIHPRDLNLLFIAYAGGVILLDLTQQKTIKAYEYFLPPGAPGGFGYHDHSLLTERKPELTALAVHPSGHLLATGYVDGSIAFWAVVDEDKPLLVTTLDGREDINVANAEAMDAALSGHPGGIHDQPEPIFKLAWSGFNNSSDPRGGDTVLSVLGGLGQKEVPAVTTLLLPPFNPPEPPVQAVPGTTLDPTFRHAMRQTVIPKDMHSYSTVGVPQDFLLLPREQPHFSGSWDPVAMLLLSDGDKDTRAIEAYQFPPPLFVPKAEPQKNESAAEANPEGLGGDVADEITSVLESMQVDEDPQSLNVPPALWGGPSSVVGGTLVSLDRDAYQRFVANASTRPLDSINLRAGRAWVEDDDGQMKLMKFQPYRILITHHTDLTVRFRDLNAQLLVSSEAEPFLADFPTLLPELTIDLLSILAAPSIASRVSAELLQEGHIASTYLATQSLECAVVLETGEIAVFRQGEEFPKKTVKDQELIPASHIPVTVGRKFYPSFLFITQRGPATACALSDIGFLAAGFQDGSLFIVDMRGPAIILRRLPEDRESKRRSFLHKNEVDPVMNLTWTVSGTDLDPSPRILLLVVRQSGSTDIYVILRSSDGIWSVNDQTEHAEGPSSPLPEGSFVIDSKSGRSCKADGNGLIATMNPTAELTKGRYLWVTAGTRGARCVVDITGEKLGRVEWPNKGSKVERVSIVHKNASVVLVAHTDKREALVYSLPFLEHLHGLQLTQSSSEPLSIDDTGDYIEWCRHPCGSIKAEKYGTLFNVRRSGPYKVPGVDFTYGRTTAPTQPQPVGIGPPSMLNTFWEYISSTGLTGDQVDTLLAGPDRPLPKPQPPQRPGMPDKSGSDGASASSGLSAQNIANSATSGVNNLYSRLNNALAERGEMLGGLEDSFNNLESGSKNMLAQAKNLAAKQTAKRWFQFS